VSPSIDAHTHRLTTTGILDTKFGFSIETGAAEEAVKRAVTRTNLDLAGLHFHLGSPLFELEPYEEAIRYVMDFASRMRDRYGLRLDDFSPGGGFAAGYVTDRLPPPVADYASTIVTALRAGCDAHGFDDPTLIIEPGRALVARAGVAVYTVGAIKDIPNVRKYVSVDGGMGDNIRPAIYGSKYSAYCANRISDPHDKTSTIAGWYCESGDILARDVPLPAVAPGDLLAMPASGAYQIPMSSNYNMARRPPIVMVSDGRATLIRRRETYDDLLATTRV
jgi:diaminopimelate decarboxylase